MNLGLYPGPGRLYPVVMARGWESKSVEEQVEQRAADQQKARGPMPGEAGTKVARELERQGLELQRERILDERTSSPIRRKALEAALAEIEAKLAAL